LLTSLQPDQAGFRDPKQAVNKKMKKKRTHRPTQVIPARRLLPTVMCNCYNHS